MFNQFPKNHVKHLVKEFKAKLVREDFSGRKLETWKW